MKTIKKLGISVAVASSLFISSANAGDPIPIPNVATEITQKMNNYELILQYATQLKQWQTQWQEWQRQIKGIEMMVNNIGQLPDNMKNQFLNMALQMKHQMEQGQAIAYSAANLDQKFRNTFKGFDEYLTQAKSGNLNFNKIYKNHIQSTRDTALNALKTLGIQEQDLQNDQVFMGHLRKAMNSAKGTEAAIAVANQLAYHQTQSIQKLQKTIMLQANLEATYMAKENDEKVLIKAKNEAWIDNADLSVNPANDENF